MLPAANFDLRDLGVGVSCLGHSSLSSRLLLLSLSLFFTHQPTLALETSDFFLSFKFLGVKTETSPWLPEPATSPDSPDSQWLCSPADQGCSCNPVLPACKRAVPSLERSSLLQELVSARLLGHGHSYYLQGSLRCMRAPSFSLVPLAPCSDPS